MKLSGHAYLFVCKQKWLTNVENYLLVIYYKICGNDQHPVEE